MHTYLKTEKGDYEVGMWLSDIHGRTSFTRLFTLDNWDDAVHAVNYLNGGPGYTDNLDIFAPLPKDEA